MSIDIYEASHQIVEALKGLSSTEIKKAILMALVAIEETDLLVDPSMLAMRTLTASTEWNQEIPN